MGLENVLLAGGGYEEPLRVAEIVPTGKTDQHLKRTQGWTYLFG